MILIGLLKRVVATCILFKSFTVKSTVAILFYTLAADMIAKERSYELPHFLPYTALIAVVERFQGEG